MIQIAEMLSTVDSPLWRLVQQVGVRHAVVGLPAADAAGEWPWDEGPIGRMKDRLEAAGLTAAVIESSPPMQKIRLGLPGRDEEIEHFCTMIRSMGAVGIPVVCYNFMAVLGWTRTHVDLQGRAGALVTAYYHEAMRDQPPTDAGIVPEDRLWDNLRYFLERVIPVAEKSGVRLAMHPDDPPLSPLRGLGRIMRSVENYDRLIALVPSHANAITLCQGNFTLMTRDLPAVIRHFDKRIAFVHFRDVVGTADHFTECFHDEGPTDMLACLQAYREIGFEGVLRPDHVPTLEGDSNEVPCYSNQARLHAIGYIQGLREAVYGKRPG